jgi:Holliday junction resolvase-like predicted endonuclease
MAKMRIRKSTRHPKITGDFGEALVLYWLSKYGFECARVDHTGIDIIARKPHSKEVMGISVKSRSRNIGKEQAYINLPNRDFDKARKACRDFRCMPYFAIVVDAADIIRVFILRMELLQKLCPKGKRARGWKMSDEWLGNYKKRGGIKTFKFKSMTDNWW